MVFFKTWFHLIVTMYIYLKMSLTVIRPGELLYLRIWGRACAMTIAQFCWCNRRNTFNLWVGLSNGKSNVTDLMTWCACGAGDTHSPQTSSLTFYSWVMFLFVCFSSYFVHGLWVESLWYWSCTFSIYYSIMDVEIIFWMYVYIENTFYSQRNVCIDILFL